MATFSRYLRGQAKKAYRSSCRIGRTAKHHLSHREISIDSHDLHQLAAPASNNKKRKALFYGKSVMVMLKSETEDVLEEQQAKDAAASITAYQLTVALERSDDLKRAVNIDLSFEDRVRYGKIEDPWQDLVMALLRAQRESKSFTTNLSSWKDAKEWLESCVGISVRKEGDEHGEEQATDQMTLKTFKKLIGKKADQALRKFTLKKMRLRQSERKLQEIVFHRSAGEELDQFETREEESYQESLGAQEEARLPMAVKEAEERMIAEERDAEARRIAASLLKSLTKEQQQLVDDAIYGIGPVSETMAQVDNDIVVRESMQRLRPGQWLNDEIIHYFLIMLAKRDEALSAQDSSHLRCHFFKSFFMTKILNEGHANPNIEGVYDYRNVKRWSKKVPGKDIFKLDKIIFPINQGNAHWICGVVFMQEKRIQMYDSLGGDGRMYIEALFRYIQDEHKDKKKEPLPDIAEWKLVTTGRACPSQRNGFDCGVFTCMFADFLSNNCPLLFSQAHITQCRERIALSIMSGSALM